MTAAAAARLAPPRPEAPGRLAAFAVECLTLEIATYPKPGLVSHVDAGSHGDMEAATFAASAAAIRPFLAGLAEAGAEGQGMARLRRIGLAAEAAMLTATGGVNTHRGAIFGLGLLCAAAGARAAGHYAAAVPLGTIVSQRWGRAILAGPTLAHSHGAAACRRYGAGGARHEAADGFPSLYVIGVPALRRGAALAPGDPEAARVEACFALIAAVEDTNLLHRAGLSGLRFAQMQAHRFLEAGGVGRPRWRETAAAVHRAFVDRALSPGGSADLLAMSLFVDGLEEPGRESP